MIFNCTVPLNCKQSQLLAEYLTQRFTYFTLEQWTDKINEGHITINNTPAIVGLKVIGGDTISYDAGEFDEPACNLNYSIIYEDAWFLGINKPGNLLIHRAGRSFRNNLIYHLRFEHVPVYPEIHATHRLDRDTSGVVLCAKTVDARAEAGRLFENGAVDKKYIAIVHGVVSQAIKRIDLPLAKDTASRFSFKQCVSEGGRDAVTLVDNCVDLHNGYSLLFLTPLTGRTHQIRVHCKAIGHPLVGDMLYTLPEDQFEIWLENRNEYKGTIDFYRHALHCASIGFNHPFTNDYCTLRANLPDDMLELGGLDQNFENAVSVKK
jgi:RluA family pseudouridine synthase